jgi:hypothetical protein
MIFQLSFNEASIFCHFIHSNCTTAGYNPHCLKGLFTVEGKTIPKMSELWGKVCSSCPLSRCERGFYNWQNRIIVYTVSSPFHLKWILWMMCQTSTEIYLHVPEWEESIRIGLKRNWLCVGWIHLILHTSGFVNIVKNLP